MRYCFNITSPAETEALGEKLVKKINIGAFIALTGDLGAGKTVFVKGLAKGLNVKERVVSPTYTIMCQYFGDKMLCHFDLYRITQDDCYNMGFDDFFFDENIICAVEWSERLNEFPPNVIQVDVEKTGEFSRKITVIDNNAIIKGEL
ncbi:MAG: tRNA (adenosine(37)-N6)-threonylcarbamoyltransferase complex ATPase subunit type 1 TsaE [Clostridiales bacterium]|nr:tRNA (adenosine(37)-N6)-threonylcarbamoyltransferase complex ATPase subunit type 1 TsaE [Clostridiales bacterium]